MRRSIAKSARVCKEVNHRSAPGAQNSRILNQCVTLTDQCISDYGFQAWKNSTWVWDNAKAAGELAQTQGDEVLLAARIGA